MGVDLCHDQVRVRTLEATRCASRLRRVAGTMDQLSTDWIEHQRAEGVTPNTIARRASVMRSIGNAGTATREEVEAWWAARRHLAVATRSNDLACLRAFYKWANRWDYRDDDPTRRGSLPCCGAPRAVQSDR